VSTDKTWQHTLDEQHKTWRGFRGNGVTGGTIIELARNNGYGGKPNGRTSRSSANGRTAHTNGAKHHAGASKQPTAWHRVETDLRAKGYEREARAQAEAHPGAEARGARSPHGRRDADGHRSHLQRQFRYDFAAQAMRGQHASAPDRS
jgi:hypothetical protein